MTHFLLTISQFFNQCVIFSWTLLQLCTISAFSLCSSTKKITNMKFSLRIFPHFPPGSYMQRIVLEKMSRSTTMLEKWEMFEYEPCDFALNSCRRFAHPSWKENVITNELLISILLLLSTLILMARMTLLLDLWERENSWNDLLMKWKAFHLKKSQSTWCTQRNYC